MKETENVRHTDWQCCMGRPYIAYDETSLILFIHAIQYNDFCRQVIPHGFSVFQGIAPKYILLFSFLNLEISLFQDNVWKLVQAWIEITSSGISGIFDVKPYLHGSAFKELGAHVIFSPRSTCAVRHHMAR